MKGDLIMPVEFLPQADDYFRASAENIKNLLDDGGALFEVPDYQRNFAWTNSELDAFWSDLEKVVSTSFDSSFHVKVGVKPHFFGAVVLTKMGNRVYEITDGQQRITTCSILAKLMLEKAMTLENASESAGISSILTPLLKRNEYDEPDDPRLRLDAGIDSFYREYVLNLDSSAQRAAYVQSHPSGYHEAQKLMTNAVSFFAEKMDAAFPADLPQRCVKEKLLAYVHALTRLFVVLKIEVDQEQIAYVIFETLNTRRKDLTESDLIKNEIFRSVRGTRRPEVKTMWDSIVETVEKEDLTEYMRFQYASQYGAVKPSDLFEVIKGHLESHDSFGYLSMLNDESEWYARIALSSTVHWDNEVTRMLRAFDQIDVTHGRPLLLAGAIRFNSDTVAMRRLVRCTLSFCVRYFTVGANSVEDLQKEVSLMAVKVRNGEFGLDELAAYMRGLADDVVFEGKFAKFSTKAANVAFYLLYELEKALRPGVQPLDHGPSQHVEHVMPKKPSQQPARLGEWNHVRDDPRYKEYLHRLGNLIILEAELNQSVRNHDFLYKVAAYRDSNLYYPGEISRRYTVWDFDQIEERQREMARTAVSVWGF
jgi:hypothetical protein